MHGDRRDTPAPSHRHWIKGRPEAVAGESPSGVGDRGACETAVVGVSLTRSSGIPRERHQCLLVERREPCQNRSMSRRSVIGRIGSHPVIVWAVKHVVSPLDRVVVRASRGKVPPPSSLAVPTLLLTTTGRRSGQERTVPLVYVADDDRFMVANARPRGERINPWVLNLRATSTARIRLRGQTIEIIATELDEASAALWWPAFTEKWPAFAEHYAATGERSVFGLDPPGLT